MWVLGVMSGTSLDGLDLAMVNLFNENDKFSYEFGSCTTVSYSDDWVEKLKNAHNLEPNELANLSVDYGNLVADEIELFLKSSSVLPELIASHGHTVLHQPEIGITVQIGNGPELFNRLKIPVACDFRKQDVEFGGQGAPLVPIGDQLLFQDYNYCVNLGGFVNLSFLKKDKRLAYDVSPLNIVMNDLAMQLGFNYDNRGDLAKSGAINQVVLNQLNQLSFYDREGPKSLGKEWVEENIWPVLKNLTPIDALRTVLEHAAFQLGSNLKGEEGQVLVTGGGVYNDFFIERTQSFTSLKLVIPTATLIEFKEALIFALLGFLKWNNQVNILASVTGSSHDHSSGVVYC